MFPSTRVHLGDSDRIPNANATSKFSQKKTSKQNKQTTNKTKQTTPFDLYLPTQGGGAITPAELSELPQPQKLPACSLFVQMSHRRFVRSVTIFKMIAPRKRSAGQARPAPNHETHHVAGGRQRRPSLIPQACLLRRTMPRYYAAEVAGEPPAPVARGPAPHIHAMLALLLVALTAAVAVSGVPPASRWSARHR